MPLNIWFWRYHFRPVLRHCRKCNSFQSRDQRWRSNYAGDETAIARAFPITLPKTGRFAYFPKLGSALSRLEP